MPAVVQEQHANGEWEDTRKAASVAYWLAWCMLSDHFYVGERRRIALLDGTVVKEWGGK
jgi:hypothetical protein